MTDTYSKHIENLNYDKIVESKNYLKDTDWYYIRKSETDEEVPEDVLAKRIEAREFIRANNA